MAPRSTSTVHFTPHSPHSPRHGQCLQVSHTVLLLHRRACRLRLTHLLHPPLPVSRGGCRHTCPPSRAVPGVVRQNTVEPQQSPDLAHLPSEAEAEVSRGCKDRPGQQMCVHGVGRCQCSRAPGVGGWSGRSCCSRYPPSRLANS